MEFAVYRLLQRFFVMTTSNEQVQLRVHGLGPMDAYHVTEEELENIVRTGSDLGLDFQYAQFGITLALSFLASLLVSPVPFGKVYVFFLVIICVGFFFGLSNGFRWYRNRGAFSALIRKIKDRQVGPVGKQGKEVTPGELNQLDSSASPPVQQVEPKS